MNHSYFKNINTYNKAYLLGFLCADGCIYRDTNKITFNISRKDVEILEFIKRELNSTNKISFDTIIDKRTNNEYERAYFSISSKQIQEDLFNLKIFWSKSKDLTFPLIDEKYHFSFLRGLIDGDGHISKSKTVVTLISTNKMVDFIVEYCSKFGINWAKHKEKITDYQSKIYLNKNTLKLYNKLYEDDGYYLKRKKETFCNHYDLESRKILKFTTKRITLKNDKEIRIFETNKDAANFLKCSPSHLSNISKGRVTNNTGWDIVKEERKMKTIKRTPRIGLDLDGVLADFGTHFLNYLGISDKTPPKKWDDNRFRENFHKVADDYEFWMGIPRLIDPSMLQFTPVVYVTARPIPTEISKKWLLQNGFPDVEVITVGMDGSKVESLQNKVDVFVDDAYHNYKELNDAGINCVLMTRSHNTKDEVEKRIDNLNDILVYDNLVR